MNSSVVKRNIHAEFDFNLKSLKEVLAAYEEEAFEEERQRNNLEINESQFSSEIVNSNILSAIHRDIAIEVSSINKNYEAKKHEFMFNKQKELEEYQQKTHRKSLDKFAELTKRREQRQQQLSDHIKQFYIESEKSLEQLREEHKQKKLVITKKFQSLKEQAERRRQLKGKERMTNCRRIRAECEDTMHKLAEHMKDPKFFCFQTHVEIIQRASLCEKLLDGLRQSTHQSIDSMSSEDFEAAEQSSIDFHANMYKLKTELDNLLKLKNEKEQLEKEKRLLAEKKQKECEEEQKIKLAQKKQAQTVQQQSVPKVLSPFAREGTFKQFQELKTLRESYLQKCEVLRASKDPQIKKSLGCIMNIVSKSISSITDRAGSDIKNCLKELLDLLKDQVYLSSILKRLSSTGTKMKVGSKQFSINQIPDGTSYAKLYIARTFIKQSCENVSLRSKQAAFPLAFAILGLWTEDCDFGKLYLAELHSKCSFAVPMYVPGSSGQSVQEISKAQGYLIDASGKLETDENYMNRMSGMIRTYAAVIQSETPPGVRNHPYYVGYGWKWISSLLNLDPWPGVTATILFDFLDVAGHVLHSTYGNQFIKMLKFIRDFYIQKIEECEKGENRGSVERLKTFIKECISNSSIRKPDGYLTRSFWNTYHSTDVVGR